MNINFTHHRAKLLPKLNLSYVWKVSALAAITVAIAEGYWIYQTHTSPAHSISAPKAIEKNENIQFVASFSQKMSHNITHSDSFLTDNELVKQNVTEDSVIGNSQNIVAIEEFNANAPYQLKLRQVSQTKEQLTAWLKQNMAVVNDLRKVMYRIESAKRKNRGVQDSIEIIHSSLNIIEDSIVLWKVRATESTIETLDNQSKSALNTLEKQEVEWQKELQEAKERSTYWQSILHKYNEKLNLYKGK